MRLSQILPLLAFGLFVLVQASIKNEELDEHTNSITPKGDETQLKKEYNGSEAYLQIQSESISGGLWFVCCILLGLTVFSVAFAISESKLEHLILGGICASFLALVGIISCAAKFYPIRS